MPVINWTAEEIAERSRVTAEDLALVLLWWQRNATPRDRRALERSMDRPIERRTLDRTIQRVSRDVATLANALRAGEVALDQWQLSMADMVEMVQLAGAVAAAGGLDRLSLQQSGFVQERTEEQLGYLLAFALAVENGEQRMDGRLTRRSQMYAHAGRGMYHDIERMYAEDEGYEEEARVRTARDSCQDCIDLDIDHTGWRPIGTLPRIGDSICRVNCQCYFAYRRVREEGSEYVPSGLEKYEAIR